MVWNQFLGWGAAGGGAALTDEQTAQLFPEYLFVNLDQGSAAIPSSTTLFALSAYTATATTLTANANGALPTIDTVSPGVVVTWNEPDPQNNGVWDVTTPGDGSNPWVLTRQGVFSTGDDFENRALVVKPYPTIGSDNEDYLFVMWGGEPGVDDITVARLHYSTFLVGVDANRNTLLVTRSGQSVQLFSRDDIVLPGGGVSVTGNGSLSIPGAGRFLAEEQIRYNRSFLSNQAVAEVSREEYINVGTVGGAAIDVSFTIPENAKILSVWVTPNGSVAGPTTMDVGWSDAATAFATGISATAAYVEDFPATYRTGSAGTIRVTGNAAFTAGVIQVACIWQIATNPGTVFFNP